MRKIDLALGYFKSRLAELESMQSEKPDPLCVIDNAGLLPPDEFEAAQNSEQMFVVVNRDYDERHLNTEYMQQQREFHQTMRAHFREHGDYQALYDEFSVNAEQWGVGLVGD